MLSRIVACEALDQATARVKSKICIKVSKPIKAKGKISLRLGHSFCPVITHHPPSAKVAIPNRTVAPAIGGSVSAENLMAVGIAAHKAAISRADAVARRVRRGGWDVGKLQITESCHKAG